MEDCHRYIQITIKLVQTFSDLKNWGKFRTPVVLLYHSLCNTGVCILKKLILFINWREFFSLLSDGGGGIMLFKQNV